MIKFKADFEKKNFKNVKTEIYNFPHLISAGQRTERSVGGPELVKTLYSTVKCRASVSVFHNPINFFISSIKRSKPKNHQIYSYICKANIIFRIIVRISISPNSTAVKFSF